MIKPSGLRESLKANTAVIMSLQALQSVAKLSGDEKTQHTVLSSTLGLLGEYRGYGGGNINCACTMCDSDALVSEHELICDQSDIAVTVT